MHWEAGRIEVGVSRWPRIRVAVTLIAAAGVTAAIGHLSGACVPLFLVAALMAYVGLFMALSRPVERWLPRIKPGADTPLTGSPVIKVDSLNSLKVYELEFEGIVSDIGHYGYAVPIDREVIVTKVYRCKRL